MCFRPAEMSMKVCPKCGANNKPIATECAQCGEPLAQMKVDFDADQANLDAMNSFASPAAPQTPSMPPTPPVPGAPPMPGTPKPPSSSGK